MKKKEPEIIPYKVSKYPIGNNGILHVMNDAESRFEQASQRILSVPVLAESKVTPNDESRVSDGEVREKQSRPEVTHSDSRGAQNIWPNGYKPVITESDEITVPCPYCDEYGKRNVGTSGDHQQYGPMLYGTCPTCNGTRVRERYRFPREIVKLATSLEGQSALVIARTLVGLQMGFKP